MEIRKNKDGTFSYKEKVYLGGSTICKTFANKTDSLRWKRSQEAQRNRASALGITNLKDDLTFAELANTWLERKINKIKAPKTIADYQSIVSKHLVPLFGRVKIRSIERNHGDQLIDCLQRKNLSNRTVNKSLICFKQILGYAELEGYFHRNPLLRFPALKLTTKRVDYLSISEINQLLRSNVFDEIYPILVLALNTGMRIGEITGLCWDRIDLTNDQIEVSRNQTRFGLEQRTKTNLVRHIPMNRAVREVIEVLRHNQKSPQYVFVKQNGSAFNPDHFTKRHFHGALDLAGVRRTNFHILRHTYASQFMMSGGNIYDLQKILGHTKVDMTMKYAHLSPSHLKNVVETVNFMSADYSKQVAPFQPLEKSEGLEKTKLKLVSV